MKDEYKEVIVKLKFKKDGMFFHYHGVSIEINRVNSGILGIMGNEQNLADEIADAVRRNTV